MNELGYIKHKDSYEHIYNTGSLRDEDNYYRWILRLLRPVPGRRMLDVACGEGTLVGFARQRAVDSHGLDISVAALTRAKRAFPETNLVVGDAEQLPYGNSVFDYVTCLGSIENLEHPTSALREIRRVLKEGGLFLTMLPNNHFVGDLINLALGRDESPPFQDVERVASLRQWNRFLEVNGFTVIRRHGYVKQSPLMKRGKLRSIPKFLKTRCLSLFTPSAFAWSIVYVCRKTPEVHPVKLDVFRPVIREALPLIFQPYITK